MSKLDGVRLARAAAGSAGALGARLGISKQAVLFWKQVPAHRVIAVEAATGIAREVLRPDLYPPRPGDWRER